MTDTTRRLSNQMLQCLLACMKEAEHHGVSVRFGLAANVILDAIDLAEWERAYPGEAMWPPKIWVGPELFGLRRAAADAADNTNSGSSSG